MIDFQAAEKKRLKEPVSKIGVKPLCAMVSINIFKCWLIVLNRNVFS